MEGDVSGVTVKEEINDKNSSPTTLTLGLVGLVSRQKLEGSELTHDGGMQT